ncbi:hypothetical protein Taro_020284 [Colocasia esculenta]|uniref:C3H1-type domain-containing protein n=1 Tax=Colocasia esculenta TaxID=4460 RepID=A0A843V809_COLES|nr:hypothetical protein [Colocasia esculenta]
MESGGRDLSRPMDEDAAKKNTDCVYFLASPLTCKKGSECEYRHSEGARINPRDCWFWLNGNCLNPKCSFRHPPLDGFLGEPITNPGSTHSSMKTAMPSLATHAPATHTSSKQSIPCYYYQKGGCLKGERCPFTHDAQPSNNPGLQQTTKPDIPVAEPTSAPKSASWILGNSGQHNAPKISADKTVKVSQISKKPDVKAEKMLTGGLTFKSSHMPSRLSNVTSHTLPQYNVAYNDSDVSVRPEGHHLEPLSEHNGREADESLRESSPGFDVLVDDECEDTDYFQMDRRDTSSHEVDDLDVVNDFDYHHSSDYNSMAQFEREAHRTHYEVSDYDHHGRHDRYLQDDHRYSERIMDGISILEKRTSHKDDRCSEDGSDLRHRLLKKRKINGLRSATNKDRHDEPYQRDDQYADKHIYHSRHSGRDQHHFTHESSIGKRLQGRISLPGKPPSDSPSSMHSQKDRDRGKDWAQSSSPGQPLNYQGRLHDRITRSTHETGNLEGQTRRDEMEPLNFAGPKSLAEIKGTKFSDDTTDRLTKVNNSRITQEQQNLILNKALGPYASEGSLSFEGPKSLSEILKRKREAALGNNTISSNGHEKNQKVVKDHVGGSMVMPVTDSRDVCLSDEVPKLTAVKEEAPKITDGEELLHSNQSSVRKEMFKGEDDTLADNVEDPDVGAYDQQNGGFEYEVAEDADFNAEDNEEFSHPDQSSQKEEVLEPEDGMLVDNMEDSDENYDQRDGELEYDEVEDADYRTYDENDQKDEDNIDDEEGDDDDDDDDFARKIGVMFS